MTAKLRTVSRDTLNDLMEFDHVIRVSADGTVSDGIDGVWAPEVTMTESDPRNPHVGSMVGMSVPWSLLNGYSGQYGYAGPIMHASEVIGGGLADDILSMPGLYVAVTVECVDACEECTNGDDCQCDRVAGWAIAHVPADA